MGEEARALPAKSHGHLKTWMRKVWNVRGGGLYACGFAVTFLWLEAGSVIEDFKQIHLLFDGHVIQFIVDFFVDSFKNTVSALIWPAHIAQFWPPFGAIGLGVGFFLFPMTLKKPIEAWLFDGQKVDEPPQAD